MIASILPARWRFSLTPESVFDCRLVGTVVGDGHLVISAEVVLERFDFKAGALRLRA